MWVKKKVHCSADMLIYSLFMFCKGIAKKKKKNPIIILTCLHPNKGPKSPKYSRVTNI